MVPVYWDVSIAGVAGVSPLTGGVMPGIAEMVTSASPLPLLPDPPPPPPQEVSASVVVIIVIAKIYSIHKSSQIYVFLE
jgi:hypothetical protein